jgi:hypothetical protein
MKRKKCGIFVGARGGQLQRILEDEFENHILNTLGYDIDVAMKERDYFFSAFLLEASDFDFSVDFEDFSSFFEADSSFEADSFLEPASSFDLESPFEEEVPDDFLA